MRLFFGTFAVLLSTLAWAGTNNLPTETGPVIQLSHVNKFKTALSGDIVPRNSSGAVTNDAGSLGSSTYRFTAGWMDTLKLQKAASANAVTVQSPASLSPAYTLTMPTGVPVGTKLLALDSTGQISTVDADNSTLQLTLGVPSVKASGITATQLATDSVTTAKILAANVTNAKMATDSVGTSNIIAANVTNAKMAASSVSSSNIIDATIATADLADASVTQAKLAAKTVSKGTVMSGEVTTTSTTFTDVTLLTVTITTTGRPVVVGLYGGTGNGAYLGYSVGGGSGGMETTIVRGTTSLEVQHYDPGSVNIHIPASTLHFVDTGASAGSNTYKLQFRSLNASSTARVGYAGMYAYEL